MTRILVVEDSRTQSLEIRLLLEEAGYEVALAANGEEAFDSLAKGVPDLILTDLQMPRMNGLELVEAVVHDHPGLPVVLMTAVGSEEVAVEALQRGAASYVPKRNLKDEILSTLERVLTVAHAGRREKRVLECLARAEFTFVLDNDTSLVGPLIGHLEDSAARIQRCDRTELMRAGIALHEALFNAIEHGNLEVSTELRQGEDDNCFRALVEARRRQPPYRDRRVRLQARLSPAESVFVVEDEGPGFDPAGLPDPTDPANLERVGGRGLLLIRTFMDRVEFNERGNRVTMTKRRGPVGG
jgi:CheY-like chemotaxis protein/anti-sigma regulatory factor (Ser/Thr protein kinase)